MLTVEMHDRGCADVDCTLHGPKRKISHFYTLVKFYIKESALGKQGQKNNNNGISLLYRLDFEVQ
jgi:hypothetical protein